MVGIASCRGGEPSTSRIGGGVGIEALEGHRGIECLDGGQIEVVEYFLTDSGAEAVKWVGCHGDASPFPDRGDHIGGGESLHLG